MSERVTHLMCGLLIFMSGFACISMLTNDHYWGGDFSAYIMQAQSICDASPGEYLERNRVTIEESSVPLGPAAYPWGFPLLLALFMAIFGLNIIILKLVSVFSFLLYLGVLWLGFRCYHNRLWLFLLVALFACNPYFLRFTNPVNMNEI